MLAGLTNSSLELQKLVAFENAFDRVFALIDAEGGLGQGGIIVQDCLSLFHNLIRHNSANQSLFRETGGVPKLAKLLPNSQPPNKHAGPEESWSSPDRDKNVFGLLSVMRLFVSKGSIGTQPNQNAFYKNGLLQQIINLAFDDSVNIITRAEAFQLCADMIRGNAPLQEAFAHHQVTIPSETEPPNGLGQQNGSRTPIPLNRIPVIEGLLTLVLNSSANHVFEARFAACECIKAYTFGHLQIRHHFLRHAMNVHVSGQSDSSNVLTTLMAGGRDVSSADPYRLWFASVLVFHLIFDDLEAKSMLMEIAEGDAENGEEVVTCIQTLTGNLVTALQSDEDERISIGYLMLLCGWLYEDAAAVNDFLGEGSTLQSIVQTASRTQYDNLVLRGLCATLLGIVYEFSTKDSPIPRRQLQPMLTTGLGRERFLSALSELRQHPLVRDFEVLSQEISVRNESGQPEVFFDTTFIEFLKDNFSRLARAIDRDPGIEIHQSQSEGVDRDLVDELRGQISEKAQALQKTEADLLTMERRLNQTETDLKKNQEGSAYEVNRLKAVNEALQKNHDLELKKLEAANRRNFQDLESRHHQSNQKLQSEHQKAVQTLQTQLQQAKIEADRQVERVKRPLEDELVRLKHLNEELSQKLARALEDKKKAVDGIKDLQSLAQKSKADHAQIQKTIKELQSTLEASESQIAALRAENLEHQATIETLRQERAAGNEKSSKTLKESLEKLAVFEKKNNELQATLSKQKKESETALEKERKASQTTAMKHQELQEMIDKLKHENEQLRTKSQDQVWGVKEAEEKAKKAESKIKEAEEKAKKAEVRIKEAQTKTNEAEEGKAKVQEELDDMLMVLADIEEKRSKDKVW